MTSALFSIQPIAAEDIVFWRRLRHSLWPQASIDEHEREIAEILSMPDRYAAFMAFSETKMAVGFAEASIRHDYVNGCDTSPVLFLEGIYVAPDARRQGIAKALFKSVEQWGTSHACDEFASDTDVHNIDVQALHRALGFEETERVVFFRKRTAKVEST
ncbi:aminoglycoside 6'-N-acetyltransferase [Pandoraea sp. NPDC087047]|uniref:aminoglycoside 6'-N-acetyltransferase n=1 Tax=Pandoraea sp. NPDC087047 TaxID=3364390 RepID=UPI003815D7DA